ncbi:alpha/beta hydrolase [Stieleria varia]|uniref:Carboxylesterase NlhH n=1 Tax=Stieleria varia TaxID=2528005 RepID=A0A5C6A5E0_9BACT|nr:alpha/beta hydrolase [Stieleria varia]TWT94590.1 Carboxylesterase NlhH [Stieleria varia]
MTLHPQSQAYVDLLRANPRPGWETMSVSDARLIFETFSAFAGRVESLNRVEDRMIEDVPVRIYSDCSNCNELKPVVVYFHGGGWVLGSIDSHDALCRRIAKHSGCIVVSVDYVLAPERPYPGPLGDCADVTRWIATHGAEIGADQNRVAVAGDSAGGNLATAVTMALADEPFSIRLQVLIYPVTAADFSTESYRQFSEGFGLTRANMQWFWQQHVGNPSGKLSPLAAPLHSRSLSGLPAAYVITAEYDVLRDEGEAYASRLAADGVRTTWRRVDGVLHGFMHFAGVFDLGEQAALEIAEFLKSEFADNDSPGLDSP